MKLMKFKRVAVTVLIVLAAYLLQCTLFNHLELAGIKPNPVSYTHLTLPTNSRV